MSKSHGWHYNHPDAAGNSLHDPVWKGIRDAYGWYVKNLGGIGAPQHDSHVVRGVDRLPLEARVTLAREFLRRLRELTAMAYVDAFSDVSALPPDAADALTRIKERAPLEQRLLARPQPTYMAVPLLMSDPEEFELVMSFAPYSIHTEAVGHDGSTILILHDTSTAIEIRADAQTVDAMAHSLPPGVMLES